MKQREKHFPDCGPEPLGLYPVVDSVAWLEKLLPLGVKTIQLRIKEAEQLESHLKQGIHIAKQFNARLFINDYWELAVKHGAYGVHLGQEDLTTADLDMIHSAGLRLGISSHTDEELHRAAGCHPSYIACGPVFETTSKVMDYSERGFVELKRTCQQSSFPVVAIGGITLEDFPAMLEAGAEGIAVISAILSASDPVAATNSALAFFR